MNRHYKNKIFSLACITSISLCLGILFFTLTIIITNGVQAFSFEFLFNPATNFGASGGILYQILGTILLVSVAAIISLPLSLGCAIFKSEYLTKKNYHKIIESLIYGLNGIPSIIFGIFGLIFFSNFLNLGISWFIGSIILAIMMLPTIIVCIYNAIINIPLIYRENALACGLTPWQIIVKLLLPPAIRGAITGLLLALARACGETAPIMFIATAFSGVNWPSSLAEPVTSLPTHILLLTQQAINPQALENAWGASLLLLILVCLFSITALFSRIQHYRLQ